MRTIISILALLVVVAVTSPADAAGSDLALASFPPAGRLDYKVYRNGDEVGRQSVEFSRRGGELIVRTRVSIVVTVLGIPVYRFTHEAEETWMNGRLIDFTSRTNDDGEPRDVKLRLENDRLRGTYNGRTLDHPATLIPASLWHPDTVRQSVLLDPLKGRDRQVFVADKGEETIKVRGQPVRAHHYAMTGQITREIWYGPDGQVVQVRFPAKGDSDMLVALR